MSRFTIHIVSICSALLILVVGCFAYSPTIQAEAADDVVISEGSSSDLTVQSDLGKGLLFDTMVKMLQRGASIDCSNSESGTFSQFLTSLRDDIIYTVMDYTGIDEVSWLSFNNSLNPLDWEITDTWEISRSGTGLADKYLNNRRLRFAEEVSGIPSPAPDYLSYLDNINGAGFWWKDFWNTNVTWNGNTVSARIYPWVSQSWWVDPVYSIPLTRANANTISYIHCNKDILDLYITSVDNVYYFDRTFTFLNYNGGVRSQETNSSFGHTSNYATIYKNDSLIKGVNGSDYTNRYSISGSLDQVLTYIQNHFRNVNIYVDGVPWSIVGYSGPIEIPIGDSTYLTDTNTPLFYNFPEPAYFDYQTLYNLLETLYNNHQVIKWQDIQGVITDVNGVPVVSTVQVYRTDYDVLADEQLHFVPVFSNNQDMTEPIENGVNIINIGASVIPDDLLVVFIWCGSLLIFALVVRRLLE